MKTEDKLEAGLERLQAAGLNTPPNLAASLRRYIADIELYNPRYALVGAKDRDELVVKHILDSLTPLPLLRALPEVRLAGDSLEVADLGSGAGLPGIPLALAWPQARFTLIERMGRRAVFLENALANLGLKRVSVERAEAEKAEPGRFHLLTSRAFRPLDTTILAVERRLLKAGGVIAAYKGRRERVEEERAGLGRVDLSWTVESLAVPFLEEERHLVLIRFI